MTAAWNVLKSSCGIGRDGQAHGGSALVAGPAGDKPPEAKSVEAEPTIKKIKVVPLVK